METKTEASLPTKPVRKERCERCMYHEDGFCKRNPPVIFMYKTLNARPPVAPDEWCGEFKAAKAHKE